MACIHVRNEKLNNRVMMKRCQFSGGIVASITLPDRMSFDPEGRYTGLGRAGRPHRLLRHRSCRFLKKKSACIAIIR
jgi:hypothetical protein